MKILLLACSLIASSLLRGQCPPGQLLLNTQAQVDAFAAQYPNCSELNSALRVEGSGITNLDALHNLTKLNGGALFLNNTNLQSFHGLHHVTYINGLDILTCSALVDFSGLEELTKVNGTFQVEFNAQLQTFAGLEKLDTIGGVFFYNNPMLNSLTGLEGLEVIESNVILTICPLLTSCAIEGLCDYLANPAGNVLVSFNGATCNSAAEIISTCDSNCLSANIWEGPQNGVWHQAANWSQNIIPDACDQVIIDAGNSVTIQAGLQAEAHTVEVKTGGELIVAAGASIKVQL